MSELVKLTVPEENVECTISLLEDEAPATVNAVRDVLPFEGSIVHGKFSGEEVFAETGTELHGLERENAVYDAIPGDVGYWYSQWNDRGVERNNPPLSELVFVYGREIRIREGADRESSVNLFGRIVDGRDRFAAVAEATQREGEKRICLELLD